jgi:hypothetical protein
MSSGRVSSSSDASSRLEWIHGVPVVQVLLPQPEPPPVVAVPVGIQHPRLDLVAEPPAGDGRDGLGQVPGEQVSAGQQRGGFRGEQVDAGPRRVGQCGAVLAGEQVVRGRAPAGLLTQQPYAVEDIRDPFRRRAGQGRRQDRGGEPAAAREVGAFVCLAVAVTAEPPVIRGGEHGPGTGRRRAASPSTWSRVAGCTASQAARLGIAG